MLFSLLLVPAFAARESVQVTRLVNPVTIDGRWTTPDEWSDTDRVSMYVVQGPASTAYVRMKHEQNMTNIILYVLVDFISDTTNATKQGTGGTAYDGLYIGFDNNVNSSKTQCCDAQLALEWDNGKKTQDPISVSWARGVISYDGTDDPDKTDSHAIYELAITIAGAGGTHDLAQCDYCNHVKMAIRLSVWDWSRAVNMQWPQNPDSWSMAYFGLLIFSQVTVPEFPLGAIMLLSVVILATVLITRGESRKERKCASARLAR